MSTYRQGVGGKQSDRYDICIDGDRVQSDCAGGELRLGLRGRDQGRIGDVRHRAGGVHRDDGAAECRSTGGFDLGSTDAPDASRRAGGDVSRQRGGEVLRSVADVELRDPLSALRGSDRDARPHRHCCAADHSVYELGRVGAVRYSHFG